MSRSSHHRDKYKLKSVVCQDRYDEGTAARIRPCSFDEIMSRRKNKILLNWGKEGRLEELAGNDAVNEVLVSDHWESEHGNGHGNASYHAVQKHSSEENLKSSLQKKEMYSSANNDYVAKGRDREIRNSETKLRGKDRGLHRVDKSKADERFHGRRKGDEWPGFNLESEARMKHSRDLKGRESYLEGNKGKIERVNRTKHHSGLNENIRDRDATKKLDIGKGHDLEASERKERKLLSKSHHELLRPRKKRSRSHDCEERNRRNISLSPRLHKRESYQGKEHVGMSSYSHKGRSGRQYSDIDKSKEMYNGSNSHYRRYVGSTSGLGGYSPRKRRSEGAAKTPPPIRRSPEKRNAKWDIAPKANDNTVSASFPSNFLSSNQIVPSNIGEIVSATPVTSTAVKPLSWVSPNTFSTSKITFDTVQLTQATRPMRRLYVENLPASSSEKAVMRCLNNFLTSSGVNHIQGTQPCISCIINKEKGQALVEFLTPEDASAALSFDGNYFSGSVVRIRRPKDFVDVATGEPEKSGMATDLISDVVNNSHHKIFIGGISKLLSSKMFMEIATAFGPLKAYQFEYNKDPNESCAFLEYADHAATPKACAGLNGLKFGGRVLTAVQAIPDVSFLESSRNEIWIPDSAKSLLQNPKEVLKLINVFDPEILLLLSDRQIEEALEDIRLECSRFGAVKSINFVKYAESPILRPETQNACENQQWFELNETNVKTDTVQEVTVEDSCFCDDKITSSYMESCPSQSIKLNSNMIVEDKQCKTLLDSPEKDDIECYDKEALDETNMAEASVESKMMVGERPTMVESSGKLKETLQDDMVGIGLDPIDNKGRKDDCGALQDCNHGLVLDNVRKEEHEGQDCHAGHVFEPGCVLVEFGRTEASCTAAHCLHGRLFDDRVLTVEYVSLDAYKARFSKRPFNDLCCLNW
ncbi:hypothetical protein K2173_021470 [Erythroxylum novogranatense]|uniref:RRM domain-containing protein n=1 Tax=Erythroxylum novogranatense TaxID=1862640 RepID=A0AAV8TN76_9ROSI|nr:hypothetical protein K2173_021470 [Erythroxylum novogranatense]